MLLAWQKVSAISLIWSEITTALTTLDTFYTVLSGSGGPALLYAMRPQIINKWVAVQEAVDKYIRTVSA